MFDVGTHAQRIATGPERHTISAYVNHYKNCFQCTEHPMSFYVPITLCHEGNYLANSVARLLTCRDNRLFTRTELNDNGNYVELIFDGDELDPIRGLFQGIMDGHVIIDPELMDQLLHENGDTTSLSSFIDTHVYPRDPNEQEHVAVKAYFEHSKNCVVCRDPMLIAEQGWRICPDGRAFARHIQQYLCLSSGIICSTPSLSAPERKRISIRLSPDTMRLMTNLLRAIDNGLDVSDRGQNFRTPKLPSMSQETLASPPLSVDDAKSSKTGNSNNNKHNTSNNSNNSAMPTTPDNNNNNNMAPSWWASFAGSSDNPATAFMGQTTTPYPPWMLMMPPFQGMPFNNNNNNGGNNGNGANNLKDLPAPNPFSSQG